MNLLENLAYKKLPSNDPQYEYLIQEKQGIIAKWAQKKLAKRQEENTKKTSSTLLNIEQSLAENHSIYRERNLNYLSDVMHKGEVLIQILHPINLEPIPKLKSNVFGCGIFITFPESEELLSKFKKTEVFNQFIQEDNPEIPCFGTVVNSDNETAVIIIDLLKNVFEIKDSELVEVDTIYQGEIKS